MDTRDNCRFKYCKCCKTKLYFCEYCEGWYPRGRKDQDAHGGTCRKRKQRAKTSMKTKFGHKLHLLGEVIDGENVIVIFKCYNRRSREWLYDLSLKTELDNYQPR